MAKVETAIQYMVLKPKPIPIARTAMMISTALMTTYEYWAGITPAVAYWMMVHKPIMPPAAIPFGIMKHSQAMAKKKQATVNIR